MQPEELSGTVSLVERRVDAVETLRSRLRGRRTLKSVHEGYFQVGLLLLEDLQHSEALKAFEQALNEHGSSRDRIDTLIGIAQACEGAGDPARALRTYLEAIAEGFEPVEVALLQAAKQLSPAAARVHAAWITSEWARKALGRAADTRDRARVHAFLGVVESCAGMDDDAMSSFGEAARAHASEARKATSEFLESATLPATHTGDSLDGHYFHARVFEALGDATTARKHANLALKSKALVEESYPEAPVQRLKAELAERSGDAAEAATLFFEAGRMYGWRGEYPIAIDLLERSRKLDQTAAVARWTLADSLLRRSHELPRREELNTSTATYDAIRSWQQHLAARALQVWEEGHAIKPPTEEHAWAWGTRAFIATRLADLDSPASREEGSWEGIVYGEQAALLSGADVYRWTNLSYLYRRVRMNQCALEAVEQGSKVDENADVLLEQRATVLANAGHFEESLAVVESLKPGSWVEFVRARLMLYLGHHAEAVPFIRRAIEQAPKEISFRTTLGLIHRANDDAEATTRTFREVIEKFGSDDPVHEHQGELAFAHYMVGEYDEAIELMQRDIVESSHRLRSNVRCQLALAYLGAGRVPQAKEAIETGLRDLTDPEEVVLFRLHLKDAMKRLSLWPDPAAAKALLEPRLGILDLMCSELQARTRQRNEGNGPTALDELTKIIDAASASAPENRPWSWIAAHAGIARLHFHAGRFQLAVERYRLLSTYPDRFALAPRGIGRIIAKFTADGDASLKRCDAKDALLQYQQARELLEEFLPDDAVTDARLSPRVAYANFVAGAPTREQISRVVETYLQLYHLDAASTLAAELSPLISRNRDFWELDAELARVAGANRPAIADIIAQLRAALRPCLEDSYRLKAAACDSNWMSAIVTPVAIEVAQDLRPEGIDDREWPIFKIYIPAMRERITEDTGIRVPGVRLRVNTEGDLRAATYLFMLHEVPMVMGSVQPGCVFAVVSPETLQKQGVLPDTAHVATDFLTGATGAWVDARHRLVLERAGVAEFYDAHAFIVRQLEALLKRNLADFLEVQDVQNLLEEWRKQHGDDGVALINRALPDETARLRLARVLRALAVEGVSIASWRDILTVIANKGMPSDDISELLIAVRLRLCSALAKTASGRLLIDLPENVAQSLQTWLFHADGTTFLAVPPEETQQALNDIRELVKRHEAAKPVLVTKSGWLRLFVRRLVALEFPDLMVVSSAELEAMQMQSEVRPQEARTASAGAAMG